MRSQPQTSVLSQPRQTSRWFYLAALLLASACLWQAAPKSTRHAPRLSLANEAHAAVAPAATSPKTERVLETTPIQDIHTGMKVLGENPELARVEIEEERITPETHRNVMLVANKPDGGQVEMTLLRSLDWIGEFGAEVGKTIDLTLTEIETADEAEVVAIEPCPSLENGPGHYVTGTFKHTATNVIDLYVEGLDQPIGTTSNHPFWSEDRQEFVAAIDLRHGERLRQADGSIARVLAQQRRDDQQAVYNLEVAGQHVYQVSLAGLLVHNTCPNPWGSHGSPAHQARVLDAESRLTARGFRPVAGGSTGREHLYGRRRPDLVMEGPSGELVAVQVGRRNRGNLLPVARERRALDDLRNLLGSQGNPVFDHVFFVAY